MNRTTALKAGLATLAIASAPALTGCSSAGEGAVSGAGLGALTGLVLGSFSGNAGEGALIGTTVGAVAGGVIGDQNERNARYSYEQSRAYENGSTVIYRDSDDHYNNGWGDRYETPSKTTYNEYHYYETRPAQPRVVIRYDNYPRRSYRNRYYNRWGYGNRYCR